MNTITEVKVGDIFHCSWGYDMTINDYYQVVGLTPSGKSVKVRKLNKEIVNSGEYFQGREMPIKDDFKTDHIRTLRLQTSYRDEPQIKISSYSWANLWDGESDYFNHMD
jgi:hypothetical protein